MRSPVLTFRMAALGAALLAVAAPAPCAASAPAPHITVQQVVTGEKFSAYTGEGPAIATPDKAILDKAMLSYVEIKTKAGRPYAYIAKDIKPEGKDATLVHARLLVTNPGHEKDLPFDLLDVGLRTKDAKRIGLGEGPIAFVKDKEALQLVEKEGSLVSVPPGQSKQVTFVFEVPKDSTSWMLTYEGKDVADLKEKATPG